VQLGTAGGAGDSTGRWVYHIYTRFLGGAFMYSFVGAVVGVESSYIQYSNILTL